MKFGHKRSNPNFDNSMTIYCAFSEARFGTDFVKHPVISPTHHRQLTGRVIAGVTSPQCGSNNTHLPAARVLYWILPFAGKSQTMFNFDTIQFRATTLQHAASFDHRNAKLGTLRNILLLISY
jgi:hypothetical protein